MAKVILPDGTDVTRNGLPDVNEQTKEKRYPLGTRFYPGDGTERIYCYKVPSEVKDVTAGV